MKAKRAELAWLENPEVFRVNRLDAHSDHHFYETEEDARAGRETLRQSLNGTWRFAWSACPADRPAEFWQESADLNGFSEIQVPGHMELQGYDRIHYTNTVYPWEGHAFLRPPYVDTAYNPVGSYVKEFDLDPALEGKRVVVSFQGAEQALYLWLNGVFIGYAEDSFTPSEFDLTDVIRSKGNRLCAEVYKRSSAAWIEDQDFFRFSGIFREVYLYAKPETHAEDVWVKAGLADDDPVAGPGLKNAGVTGSLSLEIRISGNVGKVTWSLEDTEGQTVREGTLHADESGRRMTESIACGSGDSGKETGSSERTDSKQTGTKQTGTEQTGTEQTGTEQTGTEQTNTEQTGAGQIFTDKTYLPDIRPWEPQHPVLYRLWICLWDATGALREIVPLRIGFRRFEIRDGLMLLNGQRLVIHGVNRHEWSCDRGRFITEADMRRDIAVLKENNINAVRTCHYPNQSLWYELCDEAGICVMDETNMESHGSWQKQGTLEPSWNVPGSRKEWEACVLDRAVSMLERDKNHPSVLWWSCGNESYAGECIRSMSRYFHEKDPSRPVHYEGVFWNREFEDISDVESRMYAPPEAIRAYLEQDPKKPFLSCEYMHDMGNSLGGMESYIRLEEEFPMYQGGFIWDFLDQAIRRPDGSLGYGGDFGDRPTDYAFSGNGLLFADRREKPAMQEARYWYASQEQRAEQDQENQHRRAEAERRIREWRQQYSEKEGTLQVIHGDVNLGIQAGDFSVLFSFAEGGPVSLVHSGQEYFYRAPKPAFWRAVTDNDRGNAFPAASGIWAASEQFAPCVGCSVTEYGPEGVERMEVSDYAGRKPAADGIRQVDLTYRYRTLTTPETEVKITWRVTFRGINVHMEMDGQKGLPELPVFGLQMILPDAPEQYSWEGLSGETYPDRKKGGRFGIYSAAPEITPYLIPQECGNHADTCRLKIAKLQAVMTEKPFHCSVLPCTAMELEQAMHPEELPRSGRTVVRILSAMRGVGGIDSWGADVENAYHVSAEENQKLDFELTFLGLS